MLTYHIVTQPAGQTTLGAIADILASGSVTNIDVAAAYVTTGGARDLLKTMRELLEVNWPIVAKRWIVAFDYCRTEPIAASMLADAPNSLLRIHDGHRVLQQKCIPTVPFHPKTFLFRGPSRRAVMAGSGNVSRSGLNTGHEIGVAIAVRTPVTAADALANAAIATVQTWYDAAWNEAVPFDVILAGQYKAIYEDAENLRRPTPTEDDTAVVQKGPKPLTAYDLRKLRVCQHFWIEAGNITRNLGPSRPGNQLMMKRLSRVFFGVPPVNVPQNSPLTRIEISYMGTVKPDCSLTFSDNGMDKLTLPLPGAGGPLAYDNQTMLFTRLSGGAFAVELGTAAQVREWIKRSRAINADYVMPGQNRRWGVF